MSKALRLTTAIYPSMAILTVLALLFSMRLQIDELTVVDRVVPLIRLAHPPGQGTFFPGSFAVNFFLPSAVLMALMNILAPSRFSVLRPGRAKLFYYVLGVVVAILEIGSDTLLPLLHFPGRWGFRVAVTLLHAAFAFAVALAAAVSRGAEREW